MRYHIINKTGEEIASFKNEYDRDMCLDTFREMFPDSVFYVYDD